MQKQNYVSRRRVSARPQSVDGILPRPTQYIRQSAARAAQARPRPAAPKRSVGAVPQVPKAHATQMVQRRRKSKTNKFRLRFKPLVLAPALVLVLLLVSAHLHNPNVEKTAKVKAVSLLSSQKASADTPKPVVVPPFVADMNAVIASQTSLNASATLIDLQSGAEYDAGAYQNRFEAASTSKLVAVFDYLHQVELGKATLTQNISGDNAQDIIMRMIVYSDNNAWARLNSYLSLRQEQAYLNDIGVSAIIQPGNLQFSTPNMAKLLQLLYQGKLMNDTHRQLVYGYMSRTTVTNLIQAVLPPDVTVYHKYGQVDGVLHDASIIQYQGHAYVLVIYTNNPDGTTHQSAGQVNLIHAVTTAAFKDIQTQLSTQ